LPQFFVVIATHIRRTFHEGKQFFSWNFFRRYIHAFVIRGNSDEIRLPRVIILKRGIPSSYDEKIVAIAMKKHGNSDEKAC
jgi:hypothetical protein